MSMRLSIIMDREHGVRCQKLRHERSGSFADGFEGVDEIHGELSSQHVEMRCVTRPLTQSHVLLHSIV